MPGFVAILGHSIQLADSSLSDNIISGRIICSGFRVERRSLNKFINDKLFYEDAEYAIVFDGVIFNKLDLCRKYSLDQTWGNCIISMYKNDGEKFLNKLRGSFSGVIHDKTRKRTFVFTDQIGSKHVYYSHTDKGIIVASEIGYIIEAFKQNGIKTHIDEKSVYMAMSYGYMLDDRTLFANIYRLIPGHYLIIENDNVKECQFHFFDNSNCLRASKEEIIERIDVLFKQAIEREFEKDIEYGYKHIATLSGGLDSRMTCWVAHEMGYKRQLNFTLSQTGWLDITTAQKIAIDLKHEFIYKMLDNGNCLYGIDDTTKLDWGGLLYFCLAHGKNTYDDIDFSKYGILHTGVLGDVILGTYSSTPYRTADYSIFSGYYSSALLNRLSQYMPKYKYNNEELFVLYNRGFGGICHGLLPMQENTETFSPFYDVDFFEFCMRIPIEFRFGHQIYFDWISDKYPKAGEYVWTGSGKTISAMIAERRQTISPIRYSGFLGKTIVSPSDPTFLPWVIRKIRKHVCPTQIKSTQTTRNIMEEPFTSILDSPNSMSPVDYWYNNNAELRGFMQKYWDTNHHLSELYLPNNIADDLKCLFYDFPGVFHKIMALTVLSVIHWADYYKILNHIQR